MKRTFRGLSTLASVALAGSLAWPAAGASAQVAHVPEQTKPAAQIWADSLAALRHLKDFHVVGKVAQGKQLVSLNLTISPTGGGGSMVYHGATIDLVVTPKSVFMKVRNAADWAKLVGNASEGKSIAALLGQRWLEAPVSNPTFGSFAGLTISSKFLNAINSQQAGTKLSKAGETTFHGHSAIVITDHQGTNAYIAVAAPHYLLGAVGSDKSGSGSLVFSHFGSAPKPAVPKNAVPIPASAGGTARR